MMNVDVSRTGVQNVLSLIELNNPGLPIPLTESNVSLRPIDSNLSALATSYSVRPIPTGVQYVNALNLWISYQGNSILTSTDGETWTTVTLTDPEAVQAVVYSEFHSKLFVIRSNGLISSSPDGVTWTALTRPVVDLLQSIAISEETGKIVIGGSSGNVFVSDDEGVTWTLLNTGLGGSQTKVIYIPQSGTPTYDLFCFVANGSGLIMFDGHTETFGDIVNGGEIAPVNHAIFGLTYSVTLNKLLVTTNGPYIYWSDDIADNLNPTWTYETPTVSFMYATRDDSQGKFIRYGNVNGWSESTDGTTWTDHLTKLPVVSYFQWNGDEGEWVAGNREYYRFTGTDLGNLAITLMHYPGMVSFQGSMVYVPSLKETIVVGFDNLIGKLNVNGEFTGVLTDADVFSTITHSESLGVYVASGIGLGVYRSTDLENWTIVSSTMSFNRIIWVEAHGKFYATSFNGSDSGLYGVVSSTDGITWDLVHSASGLWSIVWSPELALLVVGGTNYFATSPNGTNWTVRTSALSVLSRDLDWSPKLGMFISGGAGTSYQYSYNGINWTARALAGQTNPLWVEELGMWFASVVNSAGAIKVSKDGLNWTAYDLTTTGATLGPTDRVVKLVWNEASKRVETFNPAGVTRLEPVTDNESSVTVNAVLDSGYKGSVTTTYYRPSLVDIAGTPESLANISLDTLLYDEQAPGAYETDALERIATALGVRESELAFIGAVPVPVNESDVKSFGIKIKYDSYLYSGGLYSVKVVAIDQDTPLTTVITEPNLEGFTM